MSRPASWIAGALLLLLAVVPSVKADVVVETGDGFDRVIVLKTGAIYRGEVLELEPNHHVVLRLPSGAVRQFDWRDLRKIGIPPAQATARPAPWTQDRAEKIAASPAPPPPPPPPRREALAPSPPPLGREAVAPSQPTESAAFAGYRPDRPVRSAPRPEPRRDASESAEADEPPAPRPLPPRVDPYYAQNPYEERSARPKSQISPGMIAAGASILGSSVLASFIVGGLFLASLDTVSAKARFAPDELGRLREGYGMVMLPVFGPFISAIQVRQVEWSVPWVFLGGAAQATGLALIIAGSVKVRIKEPTALLLLPSASPAFAGLTAFGRF